MALATFVKISSVNNLSDARYCAGMEVDQLGFVIEEGEESYVSSEDFKEIADWLSGVEFVGEVNTAQSDLSAIIANYKLDAIQIRHEEQIEAAFTTGLKVVFHADNQEKAEQILNAYPKVDYILLDTDTAIDASICSQPQKVVITSGFDANNVKSQFESSDLKGIAMKGGDEIRPGYKDFDELGDILEALDTDEYV